jgi:hypothetical protein
MESVSLCRADEKLTAFVELESAISRRHFIESNLRIMTASGWLQRLVRWVGNATKQYHGCCIGSDNKGGDDRQNEIWPWGL